MKKILSLLVSVALAASCMIIPCGVQAAKYTNTAGSVKVVCGKYKTTFKAKDYRKDGKPNFSRALETALQTAGKKATDKKKATVTLSKGKYVFDRVIKLYSNTELVATGCSLRNQKKDNIISVSYKNNNKKVKGYAGFKNITITGGSWDAQVPFSKAADTKGAHSTMRFAHSTNIVIRKASFINNYNAHDIECVGIKGLKVYNCKFKNSKNVNTAKIDGGHESIQLDVCHKIAAPNMLPYDGTTCKDVYIYKNTFTNKYRAVGSHHAVVGNTYDNINMYSNTIDNAAGIAVNAVYWTNSKIYGNTFKNVGSGIDLCSFSNHNIHNDKKLSYEKIDKGLKASDSYIYNNKITVRASNNPIEFKFGVRAIGADCTSGNKNTGVPNKIYYSYGVHIGTTSRDQQGLGNTISGPVNAGVAAVYTKNCEIEHNTVNLDASGTNKDASFGCFIVSSYWANVYENKFTHSNADTATIRDGITIRGGKEFSVCNNTIKVSDYGVQLLYGPDEVEISGNNITSNRSNCVYLSGKEDPTPDKRKTLKVYANELHSLNQSKDNSNISVLLSTTDLSAYANLNARVCIRGRGSSRTTMVNEDDLGTVYDLYSNRIDIFHEAGTVQPGYSMRWFCDGSPEAFRIFRYDEELELVGETRDTFFTDIYEADYVFLYRVIPFITNDSITLYGSPSDTASESYDGRDPVDPSYPSDPDYPEDSSDPSDPLNG